MTAFSAALPSLPARRPGPDRPSNPAPRPAPAGDIGPLTRWLIGVSCTILTFLCAIALIRAGLGLVGDLHMYAKLPVWIHVAAVVPAIPLGGYLMLARKGTPRHKQLGKLWLVLMLITATSAIFIKSGGGYSPIHIMIPVIFHAAWQAVSTARRGDIAAHRKSLTRTYILAVGVPGIIAFAVPGRLMQVMLLG